MRPLRSPAVLLAAATAILVIGLSGADEGDAGTTAITITADRTELRFDTVKFTVKAGAKVRLTLVNPEDSINLQPHNLLIIEPGKLEEIGMAANAELADPAFLSERHAVPSSNYVLHHTKLLLPGESETLEFVAPTEIGDYPFLCSYPGHWSVMNGVMTVEN
jgi:azurin